MVFKPFHSDGFSIHIDTINMDLSILFFRGHRSEFQHISVPEDFFILANSANPDEMPHYAAFHQGLHCLPKYLFTGIHNEKG